MINNTLKPRRGSRAIMSSLKKNIVLAAGEVFFELPNTTTSPGKIKIGDGETPYKDLPYFLEQNDSSTEMIEVVPNLKNTSANALADVVSGKPISELIGSLKQAIALTKTELKADITQIDNENDAIIDRLSVNDSEFYFDYHDGKFGYNTSSSRGADTFSPFSKGTTTLLYDITDYTTSATSGSYSFTANYDKVYMIYDLTTGYNVDQSTYTISLASGSFSVISNIRKRSNATSDSMYSMRSIVLQLNNVKSGDTVTYRKYGTVAVKIFA